MCFSDFLLSIRSRKKRFDGDYTCDFSDDALSEDTRPDMDTKEGWLKLIKKENTTPHPHAVIGLEQAWEEYNNGENK